MYKSHTRDLNLAGGGQWGGRLACCPRAIPAERGEAGQRERSTKLQKKGDYGVTQI